MPIAAGHGYLLTHLFEQLKLRPYVRCKIIRISIQQPHNLVFDYQEDPKEVVARLTLTDRQTTISADERLKISDCFQKCFNLLTADQMNEILLSKEENVNVRYHEACLNDLSAAVSKLGNHVTTQTDRLSDFLITKTAELDKRFQDKEAALDVEHGKRTALLKKREDAFEADKAKFDARDRTIVRREILTKMEALLKARKETQFSELTQNKRRAVHAVFIALLGLSAFFVYHFVKTLTTAQTPDWHLLVPLSAGDISC